MSSSSGNVTTVRLEGITVNKTEEGITFNINVQDLIPVLKTLSTTHGRVKGVVSPIKNPTDKITHLFFAVIPVINIDDQKKEFE